MSNSIIIGIHGLSNKPNADILEAGWKSSILEGLEKNHNLKNIKINFKSVYWADVMYNLPDDKPDLYRAAKPGDIKKYKDGIKDWIRKEALDFGGDVVGFFKRHFGIDAIADKILEEKLKDLHNYYYDSGKRRILRDRLRSEILKNKDKRIMIISHSMGSIVAYDVLRELGREFPRLIIDHFITIGSPLGLPHVLYKIEEENPLLRTPSIVKKWTNFADKRDPVAVDTHLSDDFDYNDSGVKVKDDLVYNDWGGINHKSYGYLRTPEVSDAIKKFI